MNTCSICNVDFIDADKRVKCVICSCYFHANYSSKGKATENCAQIIASEEKLVNMKQPYSFVYRCSKCATNQVISSQLEKNIIELNASLKSFEHLKSSLDLLPSLVKDLQDITKTTIPQINEEINRINVKVDNLEEKVDNQLLLLNPDVVDPQKVQQIQEQISCAVIKEINEKKYREKNVIVNYSK